MEKEEEKLCGGVHFDHILNFEASSWWSTTMLSPLYIWLAKTRLKVGEKSFDDLSNNKIIIIGCMKVHAIAMHFGQDRQTETAAPVKL